MSDTPWYIAQSRKVGSAYQHFSNACKENSSLDEKTQELLKLALACVLRCPHCTGDHIQGALDAGASKQEVTDTLLIAAVEGAGTQLAWTKETNQKYLGEED